MDCQCWAAGPEFPSAKHIAVLLGVACLAGTGLPAALTLGAGCGAEGTGGFVIISWLKAVFTPSF